MKWINLISLKDFIPTTGHRVRCLHFSSECKTYLYRMPTIVPKTTKPSETKRRPTEKARIRTSFVRITKRFKPSGLFSQTGIDGDTTPSNLLNKLMSPLLMLPTEELATSNDEMSKTFNQGRRKDLQFGGM